MGGAAEKGGGIRGVSGKQINFEEDRKKNADGTEEAPPKEEDMDRAREWMKGLRKKA